MKYTDGQRKLNENGKKSVKMRNKQIKVLKLKMKKLTVASLIVLGLTKVGVEGYDFLSNKIEEEKRINTKKDKMVEEMIEQEYAILTEEIKKELYAEDPLEYINQSDNPDFYTRIYIADNLNSKKGTITDACNELDFMKDLKSTSWLNYGFSMENNSDIEKLCNYLTISGYSPLIGADDIHNQLVNCTTNLSEDFKRDVVFNGIEDTKHKYYKGKTR